MRSNAAVLAVLSLLLPLAPAQNPVSPAPKVALAFNRYYDYAEMVAALKAIAAAHPDLVTLESIGRSYEGRDMWVATLADRTGTPLERRPAMWIDANGPGNEGQGEEGWPDTLWFLTENRERNEKIRELLSRNVFYVLPTQNPDGRDWWFHG